MKCFKSTILRVIGVISIIWIVFCPKVGGEKWFVGSRFNIGSGIKCKPYYHKISSDQNEISWSFVAITDPHTTFWRLDKAIA